MKQLFLFSLCFWGSYIYGQVSGNSNYQTRGNVNYPQGNVNYQNTYHLPESNINVAEPVTPSISISIKGLANLKADAFVAIFSATQIGKTTEEVNELLNSRITQAVNQIKQLKGTEVYVDMISFVPVYEFEVEKKMFSKKTFNEIPKGFELKKNIHVKYNDPATLDELIKILSAQEIYDLVRVDYYSSEMEGMQKQLKEKANSVLSEKLKFYESILGGSLATNEKRVNEGFRVMLPVEQYKAYEAYNASPLSIRKNNNVNYADKSITLYYQPILNKEFDFVINPVIVEPVIQVLYELKVVVVREKEKVKNLHYLITPNGELKQLDLK